MKLKKLIIKNLYNSYNYDVRFNDDITFIYGLNGCGKTTVLNITEYIITGNLFNLFDYCFDEIELTYNNHDKEELIAIKQSDESLIVDYVKGNFTINKIKDDDFGDGYRENKYLKKRHRYFDENSNLEVLSEMFNYVYLPLNRTQKIEDRFESMNNDSIPYYRRHYFSRMYSNIPENIKDKALLDVETLIFDTIRQVNYNIAEINDNFRNEILKLSLNIEDVKFDEFKEKLKSYSSSKIKKIEGSYLKLLSDLNIMSEEEKSNFKKFFETLLETSEEEYTGSTDTLINLIFKYNEIIRIEKFTEIASNAERQKENAQKKVKVFEDTINRFLENSEEDKKIVITNEGFIGFNTKSNEKIISVHYLSSGERQLLIFFANLIFSVDDKQNGIFIVDEPELSLHLSWQKVFVETAIEINPNIQMIFATHSPEFIGKHRNKMYKLQKKNSMTGE